MAIQTFLDIPCLWSGMALPITLPVNRPKEFWGRGKTACLFVARSLFRVKSGEGVWIEVQCHSLE